MSILDGIKTSSDLKKLSIKELEVLCSEIREKILETAKENGGHLSSNLGIVETTVAVHYVFDLPDDKLIFDVGHQCYAHKLLSGRKDAFPSIRTDGGISGFPNREEGDYDTFTTGHAGASISTSIGLCKARDMLNKSYKVVDVVGDGSFVNGLNLEAITSTNNKPTNLVVILNDNEMSISKNTNGFYNLISKGTIQRGYVRSKRAIKKIFGERIVYKIFNAFRTFFKKIFGNNYFEKFGFKYVGVVDGNNISDMVSVLKNIKSTCYHRAVLLYVKTTKGKGLPVAEEHADIYHGVGKNLDVCPGGYSAVLGEELKGIIGKDKRVVAVTAAMKDGTGLSPIEKFSKNNFVDVGIAEEYAVTMSAGMAAGGLKPVVAVYSTFLQRAYDQISHDVCLNNLPVVLCLDRAGLVGADGKTHQGVFDLSYLTHLPNMTVLAPTSKEELKGLLNYALSLNSPVAIRYPNDKICKERAYLPIENSLWEVLSSGSDVNILAVGPRMLDLANEVKEKSKLSVGVINARSVKPLDEKTLKGIVNTKIVTLEENSVIGGFGAYVSEYLSNNYEGVKVYNFGIKDKFVSHGKISTQLKDNGLTVENILSKIEN